MFSSMPTTVEEATPRRRRAKTDNSIRIELLQQQLAEDRRQKLQSAMGKLKERDYQVRTPSPDMNGPSPFLG